MTIDTNDMKKVGGAAAAGAGAALVLAMFTPAAVLLAVGGAVAGGAYLYSKMRDENRKTAPEKPKTDTGKPAGPSDGKEAGL